MMQHQCLVKYAYMYNAAPKSSAAYMHSAAPKSSAAYMHSAEPTAADSNSWVLEKSRFWISGSRFSAGILAVDKMQEMEWEEIAHTNSPILLDCCSFQKHVSEKALGVWG